MFQQSRGNQAKFVMHDLINDLAQWVSGDTCFRLEDEFGTNKPSKRLDMTRHSSYNCDFYDVKDKFEVFHKFKHLRTFLPISLHDSSVLCYMPNVVLSDLLLKLKRLRVLSLRKYYVIKLPNSVGGLEHLRYLDLSSTMIKCLPESTSSLFNLQFLILKDCPRLMKLPSDIRNLVNLRYLDISGENLIREMPLGMNELRSLRRLSKFVVGKDTGSGLEDLRNLKFLGGELCISKLENVTDSQDIREALLKDKKNLDVLLLEWGSQFDHSRNEESEENVLDMLQPQRNLKELTIKCYSGRIFPSWIGDPSFSKMSILKLEWCKNCTVLPPLAQLSSLRDLTIVGMAGIKRIGSELYGDNNSLLSFQSLESLSFVDLAEWEHWDPADEDEHVYRFPCLRKLFIIKCPKLSERLPNHLSLFENLVIHGCPELVVSLSYVPVLCELRIDGCKRMVYSTPTELQLLKTMEVSNISDYGNWLEQSFPKVDHLKVAGFEGFRLLWLSKISNGKTPQWLHSFTSLRHLCIEDCASLASFPDASHLSGLRKLVVINCSALTSFPEGIISPLKNLIIWRCKQLKRVMGDRDYSSTSSSVIQFPESLQYLTIRDCPKLESIAEGFHKNSSLEYIFLYECKELKFLPEGMHNLSYLRNVIIQECSNLVSFPEGGLPITNLYSLSIISYEKLQALPDGMHSIMSLKQLTISGYGTNLLSFPEEGLPTNLICLSIADQNICKQLLEWGVHKLTSLRGLHLTGCFHVMSFPDEEIGMRLPSSLINLVIRNFPKLKCLSSKGFQNLTSLNFLSIGDCPNLTSFPKEGLPSSLLSLRMEGCPMLKKQCKRGTGKEWSKIAHIPSVFVDERSIYSSEEDDIPFPPRSYYLTY